MKVTKSYIKQLVMEELSLEADGGGATFGQGEQERADASTKFFELIKLAKQNPGKAEAYAEAVKALFPGEEGERGARMLLTRVHGLTRGR